MTQWGAARVSLVVLLALLLTGCVAEDPAEPDASRTATTVAA